MTKLLCDNLESWLADRAFSRLSEPATVLFANVARTYADGDLDSPTPPSTCGVIYLDDRIEMIWIAGRVSDPN